MAARVSVLRVYDWRIRGAVFLTSSDFRSTKRGLAFIDRRNTLTIRRIMLTMLTLGHTIGVSVALLILRKFKLISAQVSKIILPMIRVVGLQALDTSGILSLERSISGDVQIPMRKSMKHFVFSDRSSHLKLWLIVEFAHTGGFHCSFKLGGTRPH